MTSETSAGGVVLRRTGASLEVRVILRDRHGTLTWGLPKGHIEPEEAVAVAAVREVYEETGVTAEVLAPLTTIRYEFPAPSGGGRIAKTVTFFLMRSMGERDRPHDQGEVLETRWMPVAEAHERLAHENERRVLAQAQQQATLPEIAGKLGG